jgi:hypothetical protein
VDVTDEAIPQWPDEAVAEAFRAEIRARFEAHNAAFRSREAAELYEDDVRKILGVIATYNDKFGQGVDAIRDRLELSLVPLP